MSDRNYTELSKLKTFKERFDYLRLHGSVGKETFGFDRYLNQELYRHAPWRTARREVIIRDNGCDLGVKDRLISGHVIVHHMNPITIDDVISGNPKAFDPEYLICVSLLTHNAIHYGDERLLLKEPEVRTPGDTCPWR